VIASPWSLLLPLLPSQRLLPAKNICKGPAAAGLSQLLQLPDLI